MVIDIPAGDGNVANLFLQCNGSKFLLLGIAGEYTVNGERCLRGGCRLNPDVKVSIVAISINEDTKP